MSNNRQTSVEQDRTLVLNRPMQIAELRSLVEGLPRTYRDGVVQRFATVNVMVANPPKKVASSTSGQATN